MVDRSKYLFSHKKTVGHVNLLIQIQNYYACNALVPDELFPEILITLM